MFTSKQKLTAIATTIALGCGITAGAAPAMAYSDVPPSSDVPPPNHSLVKEERLPFTGYVMFIAHDYMLVADTPTREEALLSLGNWWVLAFQDKLLKVPISSPIDYNIGEKVKVYARAMTNSIPPLAIVPNIERLPE